MRLPALALALALTGCASALPSQTCGICGPVGVQPPAPGLVAQAMIDGRAQALATCPGVTSNAVPNVSWQRCQFVVSNAKPAPDGSSLSGCEAGATYASKGVIWISLAEPERVLPLVTWEARNFYWCISGCCSQAY
jgi:hypothetical protein